MKTHLIRSVVAATLLASGVLSAAELPFNAPATERAQESAQLLHRAAYALQNAPSPSLQSGNQKISDLWLFPTADADTVFAQYRLSSETGNATASTQHLSLLKLSGEQIIEFRELTDGRAASSSSAAQVTASKDWSAAIGTGHALRSDESALGVGTPGSPDWSAAIGTGHAADLAGSSTDTLLTAAAPSNASVHWSAKFGTGRAFEAAAPASKSSAVIARSAVNVDGNRE